MLNNICYGHENGFTHLDSDQYGIETDFDIGIKFVEEPTLSDENYTGEPYLSLYITIRHEELLLTPKRIEFSVYRRYLQNRLSSTQKDRENLLQRAICYLKDSVKNIKTGKTIDWSDEPKFV